MGYYFGKVGLIYEGLYEGISCLSPIEQAEMYNAIFQYQFKGEVKENFSKKELQTLFKIFLPFIDKFLEKQQSITDRKSKEYSNWRTAVFIRDNYTCQICGQVGGKLNAHHIKHFAKDKKRRFDINNGITLCYECHKEVHSKRSRE